jgi:hypothetical protein
MPYAQHREGEQAMHKRILRKRILKGLVIALALFAVIPITNAAAKPVSPSDDPYPRPVPHQSQAVFPQSSDVRAHHTVAELQANSARGEGSDVNWSNGGIEIGIVAALLLGTAGVLVVRNLRHGRLAR